MWRNRVWIRFSLDPRNHPDLIKDIRWQPAVLILLIGIPLTLLANAIELSLMSASVGHHLKFIG